MGSHSRVNQQRGVLHMRPVLAGEEQIYNMISVCPHAISMNWTLKHVSVKGQIVVKTCQIGSLNYIKYQDIETEVEGQMEKWQSQKSSQRLRAAERWDKNEEMKERVREVKCTQRHRKNQRSDRSTSEGGGRDKLKKVDGDFPTCMRQKKDDNDDNTRKTEDLKGKGGGRLKHYNLDGDVPLCLRKTKEKSKDRSNSKNDEEK